MIDNDSKRPDWLTRSPSKAIKQAIMNADKAFRDYLKGNKGKPRLKKKTRDNSFYLIGTIKVERHRIFLPKLKWVRLKEFGYIPNNVKSETVSMKNGRYYVSCLVHETKDERITRIRTDYNQKALQSILRQKPRFIVIEDLNVKGLMKNRHLSKAISKAQWYQSRVFLQQQCEKLGIELRLAPRFYPSSKLCSVCGYKNKDLKLKKSFLDMS